MTGNLVFMTVKRQTEAFIIITKVTVLGGTSLLDSCAPPIVTGHS